MSLDVYLYAAGCEHCGRGEECLYSANITHNLNVMADAAGMYEALWRPENIGAKHAGDIVPILEVEALNPKNGWGAYEGLMRFVRDYLDVCKANPNARVKVSR